MSPEEQWQAVARLADWSAWAAFSQVALTAPKLPGVYMFRDPRSRMIVYVGMAGERAGSGAAKGLWGRLGVYRIGKGATSGFGEAALDRALNDERFLESQLRRVRAGETQRAKTWAIDAIEWWAPEICWSVQDSKADALALEARIVSALHGTGLKNRGPSRAR